MPRLPPVTIITRLFEGVASAPGRACVSAFIVSILRSSRQGQHFTATFSQEPNERRRLGIQSQVQQMVIAR